MYTERICVFGIVQGVGFRPFVSRIATAHSICGTVCNKGSYVEILAQGSQSDLAAFREDLEARAPERSAILKVLRESEDRSPMRPFPLSKAPGKKAISSSRRTLPSAMPVRKNSLTRRTAAISIPSSTARPAGRG